jgi:hypothetical protein
VAFFIFARAIFQPLLQVALLLAILITQLATPLLYVVFTPLLAVTKPALSCLILYLTCKLGQRLHAKPAGAWNSAEFLDPPLPKSYDTSPQIQNVRRRTT